MYLSIEDILENVDVERVARSFNLKSWEVEELLNLENTSEWSLNKFRLINLYETLKEMNPALSDIGLMIRDVLEDVLMGYDEIDSSVLQEEVDNELTEATYDLKTKHFDFELLTEMWSGEIKCIHVFHDKNCSLSEEAKQEEYNKILSFFGLNK